MSNIMSSIKVSGGDAQTFLQGQLSNDIDKIIDENKQLNAYCQYQGRVIALLWVSKKGDDFYLDVHNDLFDVVNNYLKKFALNTEVVFSKVEEQTTTQETYITLATSEKFIPQDLNLDIKEVGLSFTKGCYPGQEVVARVHYLGKPKKRFYKFECDFDVLPMDKLTLADATKVVGLIVTQVKHNFFAVVQTAAIKQNIFVNNKSVKLLNLVTY